jgi:hypothetical protein
MLEATVPPRPNRRVPFGAIVSTTLVGGVLRLEYGGGVLLIQSLDVSGALRELAERIDAAAAGAHA